MNERLWVQQRGRSKAMIQENNASIRILCLEQKLEAYQKLHAE